MTDLLREVDEALRADKMARFWEEHGKAIIILVATFILGTALQSGWSSWQASQEEKGTSQFLNAFKEKEPLTALEKLAAQKDGKGQALGAMGAAAIQVEKEDWTKAIDLYTQVLNDKAAPQVYKDLALIQIVSLRLDHTPDVKAEELLAQLKPVLSSKDSSWVLKAELLSAVIKANKQNDFKGALADLDKIIGSPAAPQQITLQAKALRGVYAFKGEKK